MPHTFDEGSDLQHEVGADAHLNKEAEGVSHGVKKSNNEFNINICLSMSVITVPRHTTRQEAVKFGSKAISHLIVDFQKCL